MIPQRSRSLGSPAAPPPEMGERPLKRPADLRAAWTPPAEGDRRYVLEDGRVPIEMAQLPALSVPAQRMFLIDGDVSVPLLLLSRPFGLWARAMTSRSTSWLSRFSVSRTFETLPVPSCFVLSATARERPTLRLARRGSALEAWTSVLDASSTQDGRWRRFGGSGTGEEEISRVWGEVDAFLLDSMGLLPAASDVDVLERMLQGNWSGPIDDVAGATR